MWFYVAVLAVGLLIYFKFFHNTLPKPNYLGHVPQRKHAVVVGAGIGGICAAKVLSSYFKKVTLIDRDELDFENPNPRSGVPHGRQLHGLLAIGGGIADVLFPGMVDEWIENGGKACDTIKDFRVFMNDEGLPTSERLKDGPLLISVHMSRVFTEFHLRRRLLSDCKNVEILTKTSAMGLVYDKDNNTVKGIKIKRKASKKGGEEDKGEKGGAKTTWEDLEADFVACATGRKNRIKKWLQEVEVVSDQNPLPQNTCHPGLIYCTSQWQPPEGWLEQNGLKMMHNFISLPCMHSNKVGMGLFNIENDRMTVLAMTYGKYNLPTNTEELLVLFEPTIAKEETGLLRRIFAEWNMVEPWAAYHDLNNELNMFEKLGSRWPNNFVALGDTVATFNPSFGQGMTHAILHANILRESFHQHCTQFPVHDFTGLSQRFQRAASTISHNFWAVVEPNDLQWPTTEGIRTPIKTMMGVFQRHTWKVACTDRHKQWLFWNVAGGLMDPASVFFAPGFLIPTLISIFKEIQDKRKAAAAQSKKID